MRKLILTLSVLLVGTAAGFGAFQAQGQVMRVPTTPVLRPMLLNLNKRMTNFDPAVRGFRFINTFKSVTGVFDITTGGLCGGMVYSALDYYNTGVPLPRQDYTPVSGTRLESFIYGRQVTALTNVMPKWVELHNNPFGARNSEFFNWGLQGTGGGRLQELKTEINAGRPVPLGLKSLSANPGEDHVVLAVGYDTGRYQGDLGEFKNDLKIFIYDPNSGAVMKTLYPVEAEQKYCIDYADGPKCWRAYFVMVGAWSAQTPPTIGSAAKEMILSFKTGGDDLRGGNDNVSVTLNLRNGGTVEANNVNLGKRWIDNTWQEVGVDLPDAVQPEDIANVTVSTNFRGGFDGDNWNLDQLIMRFRDNTGDRASCDRNPPGKPLIRFTGDAHKFTTAFIPCPAG
jgi:hypothetical protein